MKLSVKNSIKDLLPDSAIHSALAMRNAIIVPLKGALCTVNYFRYRRYYAYPVIYIAACPKTASTWLSNLLVELLPGFKLYHPKSHAEGQDRDNYDVTDNVINELRGKLVVVRSHTPATSANITAMNRGFSRYLALTRDMRDVIVSVYYHIQRHSTSSFLDYGLKRTLPWVPVSPNVLSLNKKACIDVLIEQLLPGLVEFSQRWLNYSENHNNVNIIRYENLVQNTQSEMKKICNFYNINKSNSDIKTVIENMKMMTLKHKKYNFRKGKIGGWREELTLKQQKLCEEIAGQYLNAMEYELTT